MTRFATVLDLPAKMREQAEQKLRVQTVVSGKNVAGEHKKNKYNARRLDVPIRGKMVRFDSKHEYSQFMKLQAREQAGEIEHLEVHVKFGLCDAGEECRGRLFGTYTADFVYKENGITKVADAKSVATRALRDWKRTKQLMKACWGHDVIEL